MRKFLALMILAVLLSIGVNVGNVKAQQEEEPEYKIFFPEPDPDQYELFYGPSQKPPEHDYTMMMYFYEVELKSEGKGSLMCIGAESTPNYCDTMGGCNHIKVAAGSHLTCHSIQLPGNVFLGWFVDGQWKGLQSRLNLSPGSTKYEIKGFFTDIVPE